MSIWSILFILFILAWILGWGVFHVTVAAIHILLGLAVLALILHFVRRSSARA
ncbi:MAG TPA: hypothetical protein VKW78_08405 [Terriglobales bacterium]|nr:hypothetical protein [Terriglobales bacterium]